jgi:hypothetical protein
VGIVKKGLTCGRQRLAPAAKPVVQLPGLRVGLLVRMSITVTENWAATEPQVPVADIVTWRFPRPQPEFGGAAVVPSREEAPAVYGGVNAGTLTLNDENALRIRFKTNIRAKRKENLRATDFKRGLERLVERR